MMAIDDSDDNGDNNDDDNGNDGDDNDDDNGNDNDGDNNDDNDDDIPQVVTPVGRALPPIVLLVVGFQLLIHVNGLPAKAEPPINNHHEDYINERRLVLWL